MSTVTGTYVTPDGTPETGIVYLSVHRHTPHATAIVTPRRLWDELDENGAVSFDVTPTDDGQWGTPVLYLVEERLTQLPFRAYYIEVPTEGVDLADAEHKELT